MSTGNWLVCQELQHLFCCRSGIRFSMIMETASRNQLGFQAIDTQGSPHNPLLQDLTLPFDLGVTPTSCARKRVKLRLLWVVLSSQRLLWSTLTFCCSKEQNSHLLLFLKASYSCSLPQRNISIVAKVSTQLAAALHPQSSCSLQHFSSGSTELLWHLHCHCSSTGAKAVQ